MRAEATQNDKHVRMERDLQDGSLTEEETGWFCYLGDQGSILLLMQKAHVQVSGFRISTSSLSLKQAQGDEVHMRN